jgi:AcrR family transcriptional regulator
MAEPARRSRRGRQAEAERNDRRVLDAAREIFAACGANAPVAAIAERAGVGMGSLYRRYGSKADLLQHLCMQAMEQSIKAAETALAASDPWAGLTGYVSTCVAQGTGALAPLAGSVQTTPQMWETSRYGRRLLDQLVSRAHRQGTLRHDVTALDIAWLMEFFGRHGPATPGIQDHAIRQRLLTISLDGLRNHEAEPLPGPPPSAQHYEQRWKPRSETSAE